MRTSFVILVLSGAAFAQPLAPSIKPTVITLKKESATLEVVATELSKSSAGLSVKIEQPEVARAKFKPTYDGVPLWEALETAADGAKVRLSLRDGGRTVVLSSPSAGREVSAVNGPFRLVPRTITGRLLLDQGLSFHEIEMDVHWEPRVPVFRIDSQPKITKAEDNRGTVLKVETAGSRHYPTTSITDMKVRLSGLTRDTKKIATLAGEFRATASERMLAFSFKELAGKFPITQAEAGVGVTLRSFEKVGGTWDAVLDLTYPENQPNFESFEEQKWLRDNRLRLIDPNGSIYEPDNDDVIASGRRVAATYRFKLLANAVPTAKGWSLICETPGPLSEFTIPFVLKNIPLP
ncbi:MAG: hypothetical protein C0467_21060 [Planctomycetaceae bacterium]|nr:hypothetical protein [Planctomycetaceae bacterium]